RYKSYRCVQIFAKRHSNGNNAGGKSTPHFASPTRKCAGCVSPTNYSSSSSNLFAAFIAREQTQLLDMTAGKAWRIASGQTNCINC
ncbi:MAG: hypothetical protein VKN72_11635, partial [Nostocales cyanobacterium 94392]|nr:hypothetical protein [Nostocales cyanobacterium 94392]